MMKAGDLLQEFHRAVLDRYEVIRENRKPGQKVVGWMCSYVPEEILYAAGLYPVRVMGGKNTTLGDAYLHINMCSLVRSCYHEAAEGNYNFLEGFVTLNTCDNIRRFYDHWVYYNRTPFNFILSLPHKVTPASIEYFRDELARLKGEVESWTGRTISEADLWQAIEVYNRTRRLLRELMELRKKPNPPISGAEFLDVAVAATILPKDKYNDMLEELVSSLSDEERDWGDRVRVLLAGSEVDDPELVRLIEESGGLVVADDLCTGSRYFWNLAHRNGDALMSLAERYLNRPDCPRMRPSEKRVNHIKALARDFNVQGVILEIIQFCKLHQEGSIVVRRTLEKENIPVLILTREYALTGAGALKTRVEAFLDMVQTM